MKFAVEDVVRRGEAHLVDVVVVLVVLDEDVAPGTGTAEDVMFAVEDVVRAVVLRRSWRMG